ncbi:MAG: spondin domain-containing protein [Acidimicrobiales bacterium]|nr:spondin domain-containing protein [Acidimicrobiales bacterium]
MRRIPLLALLGALTVSLLAVIAAPGANATGQRQRPVNPPPTRTYEVTVTNLTPGQILTPPVFAAHLPSTLLFHPGYPATPEVQQIAENGNLAPLATQLSTHRRVAASGIASADTGAVADGSGPIFAGQSRTFQVTTTPNGTRLSTVSMVVCTNDGFTGLESLRLPTGVGQSTTVHTYAYDAGTEVNTELLADLVPPCSGGTTGTGMSNTALAEGGVITMHPGIGGPAGPDRLDPAVWGWTGPVASFTVTRVA